jgi:hypothetical protein
VQGVTHTEGKIMVAQCNAGGGPGSKKDKIIGEAQVLNFGKRMEVKTGSYLFAAICTKFARVQT